jgi:hypothetical protein
MAAPPVANALRVRMTGIVGGPTYGWRFFLGYGTDVLPTVSDANAIAAQAAAAWNTHLAEYHVDDRTLTAVAVEDLSSEMGATGGWAGSHTGSLSGTAQDAAAAVIMNFTIASRYRGGHPKAFLPAGAAGWLETDGTWQAADIDNVNGSFALFMEEVLATTGLTTTLTTQVALQLYKGFLTTGPDSEGRYHYPPKYRPTAGLLPVSGAVGSLLVGSQRRRRESTTP